MDFNIFLSADTFLQYPTVIDLYNCLRSLRPKKQETVQMSQGEIDIPFKSLELTEMQRQLCFLEQNRAADNTAASNVLFVIEYAEARWPMRQQLLEIIQSQIAIRSVFCAFSTGCPSISQSVAGTECHIGLTTSHLTERHSIIRHLNCERQFKFCISKIFAAPIRVQSWVMKSTNFLLVNFHHICTDGYSMRLLARWFAILDDAKKLQQFLNFALFTTLIKQQQNDDEFIRSKMYWSKIVVGYDGFTLPRSNTKLLNVVSQRDSLRLALKVRTSTVQYSFYTHLAGWVLQLLAEESADMSIVIGCPFQNRDLTTNPLTMGCFTGIFPIRVNFAKIDGSSEQLYKVVQTQITKFHSQNKNCLLCLPGTILLSKIKYP